MLDSWLHGTVCGQKHELCVRVGYMKLCVETCTVSNSWVHEAVCGQRSELS